MATPGQRTEMGNQPTKEIPSKVAVFQWGEKTFRVHKERVVIGSVTSADVRLSGKGVAPIHAVVEVNQTAADEATIFDLASDTGVTIDGQKVVTQKISSNTKIDIGAYHLRFTIENVQQAAKTQKRPVRESGGQKLFVDPKEDVGSLVLEDEREIHDIFDYKNSDQVCLETVMSWRSNILAVEHYKSQRRVTIGPVRSNDFGIPPTLSSNRHPLITRKGNEYTLNIDPAMKGVIQRTGSLDEIPAGQSRQVSFGVNDFAKISVGEVDFYLSFTPSPPRLRRQKVFQRDPFFMKIVLISFVFSSALMGAVFSFDFNRTIQEEEIPERVATVLYQPEKFTAKKKPKPKKKVPPPEKVKEKPKKVEKKKPPKIKKLKLKPKKVDPKKPIPKTINVSGKTAKKNKSGANKQARRKLRAQGNEGAGARARGNRGTRGSKRAQNQAANKQNAARRPSPEAGKGRGSGKSQVANRGNLNVLKGASNKVLNLLGNTKTTLGKGGARTKGFGGFTTKGSGGLALGGSGRGGGGSAASLGGLGKSGSGGGRVGTGLGAAGSGSSIIGGKSRVVIQSGGSEEAVVMGSIDASAVEAALLRHKDEFRLCYEREINAERPDLAGRVGTTFVIGASGRAVKAGVSSSSLKNNNVHRCIVRVIKRIQFPQPKGGGVVQVNYPFKFRPVG